MTINVDNRIEKEQLSAGLLSEMGPWTSSISLSEEAFEELSTAHPEVILEQDIHGKIIFTAPVHHDSGFFEMEVSAEVRNYTKETKNGKAFSPSTGFRLPDGSLRSPDAAFVSKEQLEKLSPAEHKQFARLVPEFIVEIRSDTDQLDLLKQKMQDSWIANGVQLAWLIDPQEQKTYVYRQDGSISVFEGFERELSGENILPGFTFDLRLFLAK